MARIGDEFLDENAVVAEGGLRLRFGAGEAFRHFGFAVGDAHALAAAAGRRLDHHRVADLLGDHDRLVVVGDDAEMARHGRHVCRGGGLLRLDLVAHGGDCFRVRPDEDDAGFFQRFGESLALGEKAVAGMHGLRATRLAGVDDLVDQKVAFGGFRRADGNGRVGHFHMQGVLVGRRINRDRLDPHAASGLDDPAGDFAAIGNQNTLEHAASGPPKPALWLCGVAAKKSMRRPPLPARGERCSGVS